MGFECDSIDKDIPLVCREFLSFSLDLHYIKRNMGQNTGVIVLKISPPRRQFEKINLNKFLSFKLSGSSVVSVSYADGQIFINIKYDEKVENK